MARGQTKPRSSVQGISVRTMADEPVRADVAGYFRKNPEGTLKDLYQQGDLVLLYDNGKAQPVRLSVVRDRSVVGRFLLGGREITATRLTLERDANGNPIGLKETGRGGRRVA